MLKRKPKINGKPVVASHKKQPPPLGSDELLYRTVDQLATIANQAQKLVDFYVANANGGASFTDEQAKEIGELIQSIHANTRGMDTLSILSRLIVTIAAAAKQRHMFGATLTAKRATKTLHLKCHYGPAEDDWNDIELSLEVAKQLRDGLDEGINMMPPEEKALMPENPTTH